MSDILNPDGPPGGELPRINKLPPILYDLVSFGSYANSAYENFLAQVDHTC